MNFTQEQVKFITDELGLEVRDNLTEQELCGIQDAAFEVEVRETLMAGDGKLSVLGETAVGIVTLLGMNGE